MTVSRRQVLLVGGAAALGAAALGVPVSTIGAKAASALSSANMPKPFQTPFVTPPVLAPYKVDVDPEDGKPVNYYSVTEKTAMAAILPKLQTPILGYNGIFPGPTIGLDQGTKAVMRVRNKLPNNHPLDGHVLSTSVHLHGSASLPQYDGYASDVTMPGFYKDYRYPNFQPARTLWYHDHGVHFTALNAYSGLAGQYHMHDPFEKANLPQGKFDVPLTITDAMFAADGRMGYDDNSHSGLWGDVVLVNGKPWPVMKVQKRIYRFRILNASISRSYRPSLSTGDPMWVVATDGGLVQAPQQVANYRHGGAERYEVLIDFRKYATGQRIEFRNSSNKNNIDYDYTNKIMAFDVVGDPVDTTDPTWNTIPATLASRNPSAAGQEVMLLKASDATKTRSFRVERSDVTNMWSINGQTWEDVIQSGYTKIAADPKLNATEIWTIENKSGGWFHPVHIHLIDFQVISRNGGAPFAWEKGPKDVVYVGEGETVRVLMKFGPNQGRYMVHCHNLPHEDHDMMIQFRVGDEPENGTCDPMTAATPYWDDQP